MGITKFIYLKADIGDEVVFRHPKRRGRVTGIVEDINYSLREKEYTLRIRVRTREDKPSFLLVKKEGVLSVNRKDKGA